MLYEFLLKNEDQILAMTEAKTVELAGIRPSSELLERGLPIFYRQLTAVLKLESLSQPLLPQATDKAGMAKAAQESDEPAFAAASGHPEEGELAKAAGLHGTELMRLGYTLSHVVHAYGSMCQSITELATERGAQITPAEFHDLNRCLDVAIAGAVTEFQAQRTTQDTHREVEHLGNLAHELRNTLASATISIQLIKKGTVGFGGSTGQVLDKSMKRLEELIDRSLTEVRLRVDQKIHVEPAQLLQLIDQIILTADIEAKSRNQTFEIQVDPSLVIEADQQLFFSALSNLIQNALKFTRMGGKIKVRGHLLAERIVVEIEDECGGLPAGASADMFKPFEQKSGNRKGLGLGLTIARRAIKLNSGTIEVSDLPGRGCIFKITLPQRAKREKSIDGSAA